MLERIGRYEVKGILGEGGFGKVYLGWDDEVGRHAAIKVLTSRDENLLTRFRQEANAAGKLKHENIVTVYEFSRDGEMHFLAMEYLEGRDLQRVLSGPNTLKLIDKMRIMLQVGDGLMYAHQNGYVHRDVKPANIMLLNDGGVKIMDFGIARLIREEATRLTQRGFMVGTPSYMSPEQLKLGESGVSSDVWAFGTIYYELVTGQHPFTPTDPDSTMFRICNATPNRVSSVVAECPEMLDEVIMRLLTKDPANRLTLQEVALETEPILLDLESKEARVLAAQARDLITAGRFEEADQMLSEVLKLDPRHQESRALRREIQKGMRERSLRKSVQVLLDQSENELSKKNFREAIQAVESALRLDPSDPRLPARLEELQNLKRNSELAQQRLTQALDDFQGNRLTGAFQMVSEALRAEPGNSKAQRLFAEVQRRMAERDVERRMRDGITKAKGLLALQAYDDALTLLQELQKLDPESQPVRDLLEHTKHQKEAHERQQKIRQEVDAAKAALKSGDMNAAIAKLEPLLPLVDGFQRAELKELLEYARQEREARQRAAKVKGLVEAGWAHLQAKQFGQASRCVDECLQYAPQDEGVRKLSDTISAALREEERRAALDKALAESAALEQTQRFEQAMAPLEKALRDFPGAPALTEALGRLKKKAEEQQRAQVQEFERQLERAKKSLEAGDLNSATQLLKAMAVSHPGEGDVTQLLDQAQAEQKRQSEMQAYCAEIRRALDEGRLDKAGEYIARGRAWYGADAPFAALEKEASRRVARKEALERAERALRDRNWAGAENEVRAVLAQDSNDGEAQKVLETVRQEQNAERQRAQIEQGRQEANQAIKTGRFDAAIQQLQSLLIQFPDEASLKEELAAAVEGRRRLARREAYTKARQQADALVSEGRFDAAILVIQKLIADFPDDAVLRNDLQAATEAKQEREQREHIAAQRRKAKELIQNRKFGEAIQILQTLLGKYERDSILAEDLQLAMSAKALQEKREAHDRQIEQLEKMYQRGDTQGVQEGARPLASEDPRARELLHWAETETQRLSQESSRESAETLRARRNKRLTWIASTAGFGAAVIIGVLIWFFLGGKPELSVSPGELVFEIQEGLLPGSQTVNVKSGGKRNWTASTTDAWLKVAPGSGQTPVQVSISADVSRLSPGFYSGVVVFTAADGTTVARTNVRLRVTPSILVAGVLKDKQKDDQQKKDQEARAAKEREEQAKKDKEAQAAKDAQAARDAQAAEQAKAEQAKKDKEARDKEEQARRDKEAKDKEEQARKEKEARDKEQAKNKKVLPPVVNCHGNYAGRLVGILRWTGPLPPGGEVTVGGLDESLAGGTITLQRLPGCDVTVTSVNPNAVQIEEGPSARDNYTRVKFKNISNSGISVVDIRWSIR